MGRGAARIEPEELAKFVKRQNRIPGITAMDVGIPGEQNESFYFKCLKCETPNEAQTQSEKGIDSTLITHLFDTMDSWEAATIVSQDADYCPAVRALRKRGKLVYGAGFPNRAAEALVRECFEYKNIMQEYLSGDIHLFSLFRNRGKLSEFSKTASRDKGLTLNIRNLRPTEDGMGSHWHMGPAWFLLLRTVSDAGEHSEIRDSLVKQAEEIVKEFPSVNLRKGKASSYTNAVVEMEESLSLLQSECIGRVEKRYLDFPINPPR